MQNNLWIKTVKPIIKDAESNKYVLDAVKSRDPGHAPWACQGPRDLLFKFWDPLDNFWTEEVGHIVF